MKTFRTGDKITGAVVVCIDVARKVILHRAVLNLEILRETRVNSLRWLPWKSQGHTLSISVSIGNPNFLFSVTATIHDKVVVFLVDTGSALTICMLHRYT